MYVFLLKYILNNWRVMGFLHINYIETLQSQPHCFNKWSVRNAEQEHHSYEPFVTTRNVWINNSAVYTEQLKADKYINNVSAIIQSGRWLQLSTPQLPPYPERKLYAPFDPPAGENTRCRENETQKVKSTMKACSFLSSFFLQVDVQGRGLSVSLLYHFTQLSGNLHSCCNLYLYMYTVTALSPWAMSRIWRTM